MTIYVGRWNLLPEEWEGINGLYEKSEEEIKAELDRQIKTDEGYHDDYLGIYTKMEFEETFNGDNEGDFNGTEYFIKMF